MSDVVACVHRREYPEEPQAIFLNAASWGLLPRSTAEAAADLTLRRNRERGFEEEELGAIQRRCRGAVASLLNVDPDEIALAPNTSFGVNLAAALVGRGEVGRVLVSQGEFPANVLPWKALEARGFGLEIVPTGVDGLPDEREIVRRLDGPDVRALAVSAVQYASGYYADLPALGDACRQRGVLFCVDAIQALGAAPIDARAIHADVLAAGGQKWLCAPWGSGFAYIRRELHERFDPPMVSWLGLEGATRFGEAARYDLTWLPDARKFELATLGLQDYLGLARSVEIFLEMGVAQVRRHIQDLHEPVLAWLDAHPEVRLVTPRDPERRAGILSFVPGSVEAVAAELRARGVVCGVRNGAIRLAPHFYNTRAEMEEVASILETLH
ncbi:MAG: aminotransferase class V-fold PLP-dependent enzyme [Gemmatimonadetes bacterium]|nr:aminotransferase class V-fold PLP-dependent enzyme [Gemmatimonadota bacterium]